MTGMEIVELDWRIALQSAFFAKLLIYSIAAFKIIVIMIL